VVGTTAARTVRELRDRAGGPCRSGGQPDARTDATDPMADGRTADPSSTDRRLTGGRRADDGEVNEQDD